MSSDTESAAIWRAFYEDKLRAYGAKAARPGDWKVKPPPSQRTDLGYMATYTAEEYLALRQGFVPWEMEQRWFIVMQGEWLDVYRSWTGAHMYGLRLSPTADNTWTVAESWVNRDCEDYLVQGTATPDECKTLATVLKINCLDQYLQWMELKSKDEEKAAKGI